jgi:hypothetical protein
MGDRRRKIRPVVEPIESRALLSAGLAGATTGRALIRHSPSASIHLNGTLRGQFQVNVSIPDTGKTYVIKGAGHVGGFGQASVSGDMHSLGFIAQGHAKGDITLKTAGGTVTLHLTSLVQQAGFQPLPNVFSFGIIGGTGKYMGAHGIGSATVTLVPGPISTGSPTEQGQFTLVLTPKALTL